MVDVTEDVIKRYSGEYDVESVVRLSIVHRGITRMRGVSVCMNLASLCLAGNQIEMIEGLEYLVKLERLDLSNNRISNLGGLLNIQSLQWLSLQGNRVGNPSELGILSSLPQLRTLYLQDYDKSRANPVCQHEAYLPTIQANLPQLMLLDGESTELRTACEPLQKLVVAIAESREQAKKASHDFEVDRWIPAAALNFADAKENSAAIATAEATLRDEINTAKQVLLQHTNTTNTNGR